MLFGLIIATILISLIVGYQGFQSQCLDGIICNIGTDTEQRDILVAITLIDTCNRIIIVEDTCITGSVGL